MKNVLLWFLLGMSLIAFGQEKEGGAAGRVVDMKELMTASSKVFRGYDWRDSKSVVKSTEKGLLSYEDDSTLLYVIQLKGVNQLEVVYHFTDDKLKRIDLASIFEEENDNREFQKELAEFYTQLYGYSGKVVGEKRLWNSPSGHMVQVINLIDESGSATEIIYLPI